MKYRTEFYWELAVFILVVIILVIIGKYVGWW